MFTSISNQDVNLSESGISFWNITLLHGLFQGTELLLRNPAMHTTKPPTLLRVWDWSQHIDCNQSCARDVCRQLTDDQVLLGYAVKWIARKVTAAQCHSYGIMMSVHVQYAHVLIVSWVKLISCIHITWHNPSKSCGWGAKTAPGRCNREPHTLPDVYLMFYPMSCQTSYPMLQHQRFQ